MWVKFHLCRQCVWDNYLFIFASPLQKNFCALGFLLKKPSRSWRLCGSKESFVILGGLHGKKIFNNSFVILRGLCGKKQFNNCFAFLAPLRFKRILCDSWWSSW